MKYVQPFGVNDENAKYVDGNPAQGIEGSPVPAAAIEHPMREIVHCIEQAGLVPNSNDLTQLWRAITSLQVSRSDLVPAGIVGYFAMPRAPDGWLKANGAAVSRQTYKKLFNAIGNHFGAGDGNSTFNLPDLRAEFIRGWDDRRGVDAAREFGSYQKGSPIAGEDDTSGNSVFGGTRYQTVPDFYDLPGTTEYTNYPVQYLPTQGIRYTGYVSTFGIARPRNRALLACIKY